MNDQLSANTFIKTGHLQNQKCSIVLDRLSICFTDSDPEHVKATCGLLLDDYISKSLPGMTVTKNPRYLASCRLRLPFDGSAQETACFEAGPRSPGQASYRLDFNPSKLSESGFDDLFVFLTSTIDPYPIEFFRGGRVTRCDVAIDLPGYLLENVIVRTSRLQKHGVYSDRHGTVQTTYLGTPRSRCVVAYDKRLEGNPVTQLRLECRLKPRCLGYQVAQLENPFTGVQLLPVNFSEGSGINIPAQFIADSIRIGGPKRALESLDKSQRKLFKKAYQQATSILPDLDDQWAAWPQTLIQYGLGKELGAVPVIAPAPGTAITCPATSTNGVPANLAAIPTALVNYSEETVQP